MNLETISAERGGAPFNESLHNGLYKIFTNFETLLDEFIGIKSNEPTRTLCMYKLTRGKNAGQYCTSKAVNCGYCGKHQSNITERIALIKPQKKNAKQPKQMTKTQAQIIEWLNTAVPQEETVLRKHSQGLLHEATDIMFDKDFTVIGRLDGQGNIVRLSDFEVDLCERNGWRYDEKAVEQEVLDSESDHE